jgi:GNAT superfamily N-acetyltransferase
MRNMEPEFRLIAPDRMTTIIPLLMELDPSIPEHLLHQRIGDMLDIGYECVGIYSDDELIGICGIWTLVKYYIGKHLEPDNVYVKPAHRDKGLGTRLDHWLQKLAQSRGCTALELNCYINNEAGLKFWEAKDYRQIGIHFQKKLAAPDE